MPKVSVIIPNYNHARYLPKRIESVLDQRYGDIEVLLLDDASSDDSVKVMNEYVDHPKISGIHVNSSNTGIPFKQWNLGVSKAKGDYIWMAESDDFADPCLLERLVPLLDSNPSVGIAYCQSWGVDENDKLLHSLQGWTDDLDQHRWEKDFITAGREECSRYLAVKCTIPNASAVLFRRSLYQHVGGACENFRLAGDWMMWIKLLLVSDLAYVAKPLNFFRIHSQTVRAKSTGRSETILEIVRVLAFLRENDALPEETRELAFNALLERWLLQLSQRQFSLSVNRRIHKHFRKIDRNLYGRIGHRVGSSLLRRIQRILSL